MDVCEGVCCAIGNTPLIRLHTLCELTGCEILGKAEYLNPGGSVKDRAALYLIHDAIERGKLQPGDTVVEGTAGNTGISLAMVCNALGYRSLFVVPETQSHEKIEFLRAWGADVRLVPAVPYDDENNYIKVSERLATEIENAVWANQFDNTANRQAHYETTGPEIWDETNGHIDAFVAATGTGGTLGGVSLFLKEKNPQINIWLADPTGSGMYGYVKTGEVKVIGANSFTEGIGNARVTANLQGVEIDDAVMVDDLECIAMGEYLLREAGLFLGGSSALNVAAAVEVAQMMGPGHTIVTTLGDSGGRYLSRMWNQQWRNKKGLRLPSIGAIQR
jgi:cysteine synthase A